MSINSIEKMNHLVWLLFFSIFTLSCSRTTMNEFQTNKISHVDQYFGHEVRDDYQWLEDDYAPEVKSWVASQNKLTDDYLSQIPYRQKIKDRLTELYNYERKSSFSKVGDKYIYLKNNGLQKQSIWMIADKNGKEEILLDPNQLDSLGRTTVNFIKYNQQKHLYAVGINYAGSDWMTVKVFDIEKKEFLEDELKWVKFTSIDWLHDGFYYSRYHQPPKDKELLSLNKDQQIYFHKLGTSQQEDILIYKGAEDEQLYYTLQQLKNSPYQILYRQEGTDGFETLYRKVDEKNYLSEGEFIPLFKGFSSKNAVVGNRGDELLILSDIDAPNYRLIAVNPQSPEKANWEIVIPETAYLLEGVSMAGDKLVAQYLKNAQSELLVYDIDGHLEKALELPGLGTVSLQYADKDDNEILYSFSSFVQPGENFSYNVQSEETKSLSKVKLNFDSNLFESKQVWYSSKDGTKVSMFIIHKKGIQLNGENPTYLYGYGGFNINLTPNFSPSYIALLEQGAVVAIANLRGGGEYGEQWHKAGMLFNKQNVFDDFIAAGEYLIKSNYTDAQHLGIAGGSNGGLLVGACMTQRPDLFAVAIPSVGVLDMLKYQKFTVGWGWIPEYGSSEQSEKMFQYLLAYSPLHNLKKGVKYPATLVRTADHDDRVVPAHSFKFASRLQELADKSQPSLIQIFTDTGHGAGKSVDKIINETGDAWSFFLWNTGVKK
ncbi:MAG: prolyl oligopeptidase family serine peptidase [Chitinophagales bacterium]|nr:prolyl oligopeptidase family serine peptidase [Chitinophagales bacterium]